MQSSYPLGELAECSELKLIRSNKRREIQATFLSLLFSEDTTFRLMSPTVFLSRKIILNGQIQIN